MLTSFEGVVVSGVFPEDADLREDGDDCDGSAPDEDEEVLVVPFADALAHVDAVVVEDLDAAVAAAAVRCAQPARLSRESM